jgi:hypothetical protein
VHKFFVFVSHLFSVSYGMQPTFDTEYLYALSFPCSFVTAPGGVNFNTQAYVQMNASLCCLYRRSSSSCVRAWQQPFTAQSLNTVRAVCLTPLLFYWFHGYILSTRATKQMETVVW